MSVEEDRLGPGQPRVTSVDVPPPGLNHAYFGIGKVMDSVPEDIPRRDEIGIEDEQELSLGVLQAVVQCPCLEAGAFGTSQNHGVKARGPQPRNLTCNQFPGLIGGIVENLDFEQFQRVIQVTDRAKEALHDVDFIVDRELNGNPRKPAETICGGRRAMPVTKVKVKDKITVDAVGGKP